MQQLQPNTTLQGGKYKIVSFICNGGFGNTYEAIDVDHNRKVAIKEFFMKDSCNRDETTNRVIVATKTKEEQVTRMKEKFMKEARALQNMSHPNIVHVENAFEENATAYYVMDYIDGTSLNDIIKVAGSLSETKALDYIIQIADALSYVHSKNILHLDVKPGNIMVDKNGKAILIDFGASKQYDEVTGENTSTLLGINTTGYAPAEQSYRGFVQFAPSTDIYALGATLYKLLTGMTPPDAQMLKDGEAELAPLPAGVSASVKSAVKEAMRPLRKDRPQSIEEFIVVLNGDGKTSTQKKNTEKAVYAKGSVNHNGKSDNDSTLLDLKDKFSIDVKELCAQTGKSQAECEKALKQTKGNKRAALINIHTESLYQKYGCTELGIGRGTCKRYIEYFEGAIEKAEQGLSELLQERKYDVSTLFSEYKDIILGFDLNVCQKICADANWDREQAKCRLEKWAQKVQRENKKPRGKYNVSLVEKTKALWDWDFVKIGAVLAFSLPGFTIIVSNVISKFSHDYQLWYDTYFFSISISAFIFGFVLGIVIWVWISWDEIIHYETYHPERYKEV